MKYGIYNSIKIFYYERAIEDIEANIKIWGKNLKKKKILKAIKREYKRRIKFYKELDKLEKANQ